MRPKDFRTADEQWLPLTFPSASVPGGVSWSILLPVTAVSGFFPQKVLLRYCKSVLKKPAPLAPSAGPFGFLAIAGTEAPAAAPDLCVPALALRM